MPREAEDIYLLDGWQLDKDAIVPKSRIGKVVQSLIASISIKVNQSEILSIKGFILSSYPKMSLGICETNQISKVF